MHHKLGVVLNHLALDRLLPTPEFKKKTLYVKQTMRENLNFGTNDFNSKTQD